jgi:hypothetical protein
LKIKGATAEYVVETGIENEGFSKRHINEHRGFWERRDDYLSRNGFVQAITWTSSRAQLR